MYIYYNKIPLPKDNVRGKHSLSKYSIILHNRNAFEVTIGTELDPEKKVDVLP